MIPVLELAVAVGIGFVAGMVSAFLLARWAGRPRQRA